MSVRSDFSTKPNVLPEVKAISSKRLLRNANEWVVKLDQNNQHRRNLLSLFQPDQTKLRHKLRDACEKLLFVHSIDFSKKAAALMWKNVFYDVICAVKNGRKFISNAPGALQQPELVPYLKQFLDSAIGYYQHLLLKIQDICPDLILFDYPLLMKPFSSSCGHTLSYKPKDSDQKETEQWARVISYRILICLGDLSRYQIEFGGLECRAKRFYQLALLAQPEHGHPYNLIATLVSKRWYGLTAAFYYCCSLQSKIKHDQAETNMQMLLDNNKRRYYSLSTTNDSSESVISTQLHSFQRTRIFIISFLYLCDLLKPKTYSADSEIKNICKRLVEAFPVCLANMLLPESMEEKPNKTETNGNDYSAKKPDILSVKSDTRDNQANHESNQHTHPDQCPPLLNDEAIFHICVLCLVNVHDLRVCRSDRSSAATAFTLAIFSHLLQHLVRLCKIKDKDQQEKIKIDPKLNDDKINFADGDCKSQQQTRVMNLDVKYNKNKLQQHSHRHRNRRRRRTVTSTQVGCLSDDDDDDLSEGGASDSMGGAGDAESDSELDDSDIESLAASSDQLSQDEATSQGEDDETNDVSTNIASSVQNIKKKLPEHSPRRPIKLAPSFPTKPVSTLCKTESAKSVNNVTRDVASKPKPAENKSSNTTESVVKDDHEAKLENEVNSNETKKKLIYFEQLTGRNHLTAAIKLLADWLAVNHKVAYAASPRALWYRLTSLVNMLPDEHVMQKQMKKGHEQIHRVTNCKTQHDDKKKIGDRWKQLKHLPEDLLLQHMSMVADAYKFSQLSPVDTTNQTERSDQYQLATRVCRLRALCRQFSSVEEVDMKSVGSFGKERFTSPEDDVIDTLQQIEAIEVMFKDLKMKDMAASRLRTQVAALESSLISEQQRDSALCLFLVPDVSSLCHDLTTIRRLASFGRFIVIISKTVIDGLDGLKKSSQGARDAIRYLESQFHKKNRYVRAQGINEKITGVEGEPNKLRQQDMHVWRFYRIIECCRYLMKREANKQGLDTQEQEGLVTVLTHESAASNGTRKLLQGAIGCAKTFGIQVTNASTFEKSWSS